MCQTQIKLDYVEAVADWFLDVGEAHIRRGALENGLKCTWIAATTLSKQNRILSSARIESSLRSIAVSLPERNDLRPATSVKRGEKEICLHVMSEALPFGGLTAMATRWMRNDACARTHCVALLSDGVPVPDALLQAARDTGGEVYRADPNASFLQRAIWLRSLATDVADYVILHIDISDVTCGVAFGVNGGAPVLLANHTAHLHWTEVSIADLIVNCRGSDLEGVWAETYRGTPRYGTIPIPLPEPSLPDSATAPAPTRKCNARKKIGIPEDAVVILTVGASFKYLPANGLDFVEVCEGILRELPEAFVVAVGFEEDERWSCASRRVGSRIRALGTLSQSQLAVIREASDVYIEGFPFGTTTSLLEAGLQGIPVVLAPAECPPPYGSDGVALDDTLERPASVEEYKTRVIRLCRNPVERAACGNKIRASVTKHHTGAGWKQYLEDAIKALPPEHCAYRAGTPVQTPAAIHEYWSEFRSKWAKDYEEILEDTISQALSVGLRPELTPALVRACKQCRSVRKHRTIPLPVLRFLCNFLLPFLPSSLARNVFRFVAFWFRGSLVFRLRSKVTQLFGLADGSHAPYHEYREPRKVQDHAANEMALRWANGHKRDAI